MPHRYEIVQLEDTVYEARYKGEARKIRVQDHAYQIDNRLGWTLLEHLERDLEAWCNQIDHYAQPNSAQAFMAKLMEANPEGC